jgi:hypothetical protein
MGIIVTEWEQFRALNPDQLMRVMAQPIVLDLPKIHLPDETTHSEFAYESIDVRLKSEMLRNTQIRLGCTRRYIHLNSSPHSDNSKHRRGIVSVRSS